MTALALAGTGGGSVAPDLVLPPGFDRVGDVVRFEQDSGPAAVERGDAPLAVSSDEPAVGGQKPAPSPRPARGPYRCKGCGELGHTRPSRLAARPLAADDSQLRCLDLVPCTRCHLRGHVAGDPDRCLYYRGSFGLGGQAAQATAQAPWHVENPGEGRSKGDRRHYRARGTTPTREGAVRPARGP